MRMANEAKAALTKGETMSESTPVYTGNAFDKFFEHVGHDVHVVFTAGESLVDKLPNFIKAAEDAEKDVPEIVALTQAAIKASIAFAKPGIAIVAALMANGTNILADATIIPTIEAEIPTFESTLSAFVSSIKALASAMGVDWTQLLDDITGKVALPTSTTATTAA